MPEPDRIQAKAALDAVIKNLEFIFISLFKLQKFYIEIDISRILTY